MTSKIEKLHKILKEYDYCEISWGTEKDLDLIEAFENFLIEYDDRFNSYKDLEDFFSEGFMTKDDWYLYEELPDAIEEIVPEGYYFGTSEADGTLIGIWAIEEEE
jgi:hypothetical protein